ncbi:MAG: hypothetical protein IKR04_07615 [Clostridia bacterium]|nr:hypothetical protein [Clostridia bacterium]
MKIRVRKGANISLYIQGDNRYCFEGVVVSLDDNEIVLQPQRYVAIKGASPSTDRYISASELDQTRTVDGPYPEMHIARSIIIGWSFCMIPNKQSTPNTTFSGYCRAEDVDPTKLHFYENGICIGEGELLE